MQRWARFGSQLFKPTSVSVRFGLRLFGFGLVWFETFRVWFGSVSRKHEPSPSKNSFSMHFSAYFKFQVGSVRIGSLIFRFGRFDSRVSEKVIGSVRFETFQFRFGLFFEKLEPCPSLLESNVTQEILLLQ
jgi:hypothetical protein